MGKRLGTNDIAFKTHESYYANMSALCDVMLIENVPDYKVDIIQGELGEGWQLKGAVIDPRIFGVPCSRTRLYCIAFNKARATWRPDIVISEVIDALAAKMVSSAKSCFWMDLPRAKLTAADDTWDKWYYFIYFHLTPTPVSSCLEKVLDRCVDLR